MSGHEPTESRFPNNAPPPRPASPQGIRAVARGLSPTLKTYLKVLQETSAGPKMAPAEILPLPKQNLRQVAIAELGEVVGAGSENALEVFAFLVGGLEFFYVGSPLDPVRKALDRSFAVRVVGMPALLVLVTGIWLGFRGHSWWYLLAAPIFYIAGNVGLAIRETQAVAEPSERDWLWSFLLAPLELVAFLGAFAVTWVTLIVGEILGAAAGLIQGPSIGGVAAIAFSAFLGYHLSKAGNTFYYFTQSAPWRGRGSTDDPNAVPRDSGIAP